MEMCVSSFHTNPHAFALTFAGPLGIVLMILAAFVAGCSGRDNATTPTVSRAPAVSASPTPTPSPAETASASSATTQLSMGGLGALDYAVRHRGMFAVAASFSGIVHARLSRDPQHYLNLLSSEGEDPLALWGDPDDDAEIWNAHNPYDLAPRLAGTKVFMSSGNGQPGPLDPAGTVSDEIETSIGEQNEAFAERLRELGIDARVELYGAGTHNWVNWQRELDHAWPLITEGLGPK